MTEAEKRCVDAAIVEVQRRYVREVIARGTVTTDWTKMVGIGRRK